jgi:hypothetical protein
MKNPFGFQKQITLAKYFILILLWILLNLCVLYFFLETDFLKIGLIFTVGNIVWWVLVYVFVFKNIVGTNNYSPPPMPTIVTNNELIETVAVKTGKKLRIIPISEIVCFQAYGDYVNIMTLHGTYLKEQTLRYFEEHLPEGQFLRVHRSHIVNLHAIEAIERHGRDQYLLMLSNKEKIKATLEGYRRVKMALGI